MSENRKALSEAVFTLSVTDRQGQIHNVPVKVGDSLMLALTRKYLGIDAICGGCCVCATCHVYIRGGERALPAPSGDEALLLPELMHVRPDSRLACQVTVSEDLANLPVTIAPEEV